MNRLIPVALGLMLLGATAAPAQTRIEAGQIVSGSLTSRDSRMYNGAHFELWIYSGSRGERVSITLRSIQFDAYVIVQPFPGGRSPVLARDDDSGGGSDAHVDFVLPEAGDYVITVTSAQRGETGAYRLSVERGSASPPRRAAPAGAADPAAKPVTVAPKPEVPGPRVVTPGRRVVGTLSSAPRGRVGAADGDWRYVGRAGETITLDMRSSEFDPFLTLYSVGSQTATRVAQDDNGGGGLNARIVYRIPADGEYVIRAERRQPGRSGSYSLSLSSSAGSSRPAGDRTIAPNSAVSGELDGSDPKMRDGTPYELWTYVGRAGETIRITLRSDDFDAYLSIGTLSNGVFNEIDSADDGAGGTHSRLEVTLPFSGEYAIRANSLSPRRPTGDYILRVDSIR